MFFFSNSPEFLNGGKYSGGKEKAFWDMVEF
jgi:hypothetical protein